MKRAISIMMATAIMLCLNASGGGDGKGAGLSVRLDGGFMTESFIMLSSMFNARKIKTRAETP